MDPDRRRRRVSTEELGLVLAGGYAMSAHGLTSRPSEDLDFATRSPLPMADVADRLAHAFRRAGCEVTVVTRGGYTLADLERRREVAVGEGQVAGVPRHRPPRRG